MNSYWRWKCEECGYEFILALDPTAAAVPSMRRRMVFERLAKRRPKNIELTNPPGEYQ